MNKNEVITLMKSSKNEEDWDKNCDKVKAACGGYPDFWYPEIIVSGLCDETLGAGSSTIGIICGSKVFP